MKLHPALRPAFLAVACSFLVQTAVADTVVYYPDKENAQIQITMPDDWKVKPKADGGSMLPEEGSSLFYVVSPTGATLACTAIGVENAAAANELIGQRTLLGGNWLNNTRYAEINLGESDAAEAKGDQMPHLIMNGAGKLKEGGKEEVFTITYQSIGEGYFGETWFLGAPDDKKSAAAAAKITQSLKIVQGAKMADKDAADELQTLAYPDKDNAEFYLQAPADWKFKAGGEAGKFSAFSKADTWIFFRSVPLALGDLAPEAVDYVKKYYPTAEVAKPESTQLLKRDALIAAGQAKNSDGVEVAYAFVWLDLGEGRISEVWRESPVTEDEATDQAASKIIRTFTLAADLEKAAKEER
jgi:hypothetical protein